MGRGGGPLATRVGVRRGPRELWECQPHTPERRLSSWAVGWFQAPGCPIVQAGGTLPCPSNAPTCLRPKEAMPAPTSPQELTPSSHSSGTVPSKPTGLYLGAGPAPHMGPKTWPTGEDHQAGRARVPPQCFQKRDLLIANIWWAGGALVGMVQVWYPPPEMGTEPRWVWGGSSILTEPEMSLWGRADVRCQLQELALSSLGSPEQQHCTPPPCQGRETFREPREEPSRRLQRVGEGQSGVQSVGSMEGSIWRLGYPLSQGRVPLLGTYDGAGQKPRVLGPSPPISR